MKPALLLLLFALCCLYIHPVICLIGADQIESYSLHFKSHVAVYLPFGEPLTWRLAIGGLVHPRFVLCSGFFFSTVHSFTPGIRVMIGSPWIFHGGQTFDVDAFNKIEPSPASGYRKEHHIVLLRLTGEFVGPDRNSHLAFLPSYLFAPQSKINSSRTALFQMAGWHGSPDWNKNPISHKLNSLLFKRHLGRVGDCAEYYHGMDWATATDRTFISAEDLFMDCYFHAGCEGNKVCAHPRFSSNVNDDGGPIMLRATNIMVGTVADRVAKPHEWQKIPLIGYAMKNYQSGVVRNIRAMQSDMYKQFPDDLLNHL